MTNIALYHGSTADIATFVPRSGINAAKAEYVGTLATDSKKMAMLYAIKLKEGFNAQNIKSALGAAKDADGLDATDFMLTGQIINGVPCAIIRNREKFLSELERAGGGYLYTLPNETFSPVQTPSGNATHEWLSQSSELTPLQKERISIDQVMASGCQILFLNDKINRGDFFKDICKPHEQEFDEGTKQVALYKSLIAKGILTNENATRGMGDPLGLGAGPWSAMSRNAPGRTATIVRTGP